MAGKTVLRTAFPGDVFRVDDKTEITHEGTEVPADQVERVLEAASANGVALAEVEQETKTTKPQAGNQGGGS